MDPILPLAEGVIVADDGSVRGCEALLRWWHPGLGVGPTAGRLSPSPSRSCPDIPMGLHARAGAEDDRDALVSSGGTRPRLLVVEDDASLLVMATLILEAAGFDVIAASCVSDAWASVPDPALVHGVFSDVALPDGSGLDMVGKFLNAPARELIPEKITEQLIVELYSK